MALPSKIGPLPGRAGARRRHVRIDPTGSTITVVAGTGAAGQAGDGGLAIDAQLQTPTGIGVGHDATLLIADRVNRVVRRVGSDGM